jgi:hypothetical protein
MAGLVVVAAALSAESAMAASIDITLAPDASEYVVGDTVTVDVFASTTDPLVGYGFDFVLDDDAILSYEGFSAVDPFTKVLSADGDGVAGLSFTGGATGGNLLLGTATFNAAGEGDVVVNVGVTSGDLSEGFGSNGEGVFLDFDSAPATITVQSAAVPEPATMAMLVGGGLLLLRRRRS